MAFKLPELSYAKNALEPFISEKTIEFHYGKHHKTYVDKTNELIQGTEFENATLEEIIKKADGGIFNNGAQVWNHTFYFNQFNPGGQNEPQGALKEAIEKKFGSFYSFKEAFSAAAATLFGSGWAWLVKNQDNELEIVQGSNAWNPIRDDKTPLLTCDVWEHAYYLKYKNLRADYAKNIWNVIDWEKVEGLYEDCHNI